MSQYEINRAALIAYIESQGWNFTVRADNDERYVARMGFNVGNRLRSIDILAIADSTCIQSIGVSPINAKPEDYGMVVEYITRANFGLKVGNFEFDYSDGEVRYQSYLSSWDGQPNRENIEVGVDMPYHMFKKYGDGLVKALMGFGTPEADIAAAES